jgi:CubicO group peptidase (beta-lactamase class C family)
MPMPLNRHLRYGDAVEAGMSADRIRNMSRLGAEWVEQGEAASLTMLVARRGVVILHEAYGRLGPEPDALALPRDALYPLVSVTKPITATCAMCLVEDGVLGLNRPVQEYVPEFTGDSKDAVMVHHLLTHTSGITPESVAAHVATKVEQGELVLDEADYPGISMIGPWALGQPCLYDIPLTIPPGSDMSYCNFNYTLLADIVGRVAGLPTATVAEERVLGPLGMVDTCFAGIDPARKPRFIRRAADAPFVGLNRIDLLGLLAVGAGSATATAWDMAIFAQMFLNRGMYGDVRVLSSASVAEMTRDQIPGIGAVYGAERFSQAGWGYGWGIQLDKKAVNNPGLVSPRMFEHSGSGGTAVLVDPDHELVVVYFSAETSRTPDGIHRWHLDHFVNAAIAAIVN